MVHKHNSLDKKVFIAFIHFSQVIRPRLCECGDEFIIFVADKSLSTYIIDRFSPYGLTVTVSEYNSNEFNYAISK